MIIDTSALLAILTDEPDAARFAAAIASAEMCYLSAASLLETAIVIEARHGLLGGEKLDELITAIRVTIEPVTRGQITLARQAYRDYGKGRHPAGLNYGDCFAYALAKSLDAPLLFKGNDFTQTDIKTVTL